MSAEKTIRVIGKTRGAMTSCRSCGKPVTFVQTFPNQKWMPFDGDPVALKTEHDNDHGTIEHLPAAESHFATCPHAAKWSRK